MYISPHGLEGSRRHRMAVGTLLFLLMLVLGAGMTGEVVRDGAGTLWRVTFAVGALSVFTVAWWCVRYWYAAFTQGRRAEPAPQPNFWPWALPYGFLLVVMIVNGVRMLARGDSGGWFMLGFATLLGMPVFVAGATGLWSVLRSPRRGAPGRSGRPTPTPPEPPRPRRDWGPVG
ncbi:hypothetical protein [Streptomyces sp. NPDC055099]